MSAMTASDSSRAPLHRIRLSGALLVAGSLAFVTALIAFAGRASPAWLLYLVPITVAALTYDVPGGVLTAVLSAAACLLAVPGATRAELWPKLLTGFAVFAGCGVVVGVQASRQRSHADALERASVLDPLTGAMKADHFAERLAQEVRRAERYGYPLGLVLVRVEDLDEFSRVFGHYKADLMLAHLAGVARLAVRGTDLIGRTGEATFSLAMPYADAAAARDAAMRLHEACANAAFEGDALEPVTTCATRIAWASYPAEADGHDALAARASERLTAAPATGDAAAVGDAAEPKKVSPPCDA